MTGRRRRVAVVTVSTVAALSVATGAIAYYALTSTQSNVPLTVATLASATSPGATVVDAATVQLSWTLPGGQMPGAVYAVTNTTDGHVVCTVATASCTDTAALPGTVNSYAITTTLPGTSWTSAATAFATATATPAVLVLTTTSGGALGPATAGTAFALRVTAKRWSGGALVADTSYAGTKTLVWSGLATSPGGMAPAYPATSVAFASGASTTTLNVTAYAAGTATLTATEGARSGSATFVVSAAAAALRYTSATPSCASGNVTISASGGTFIAKVSRDKDAYGNTATLSGTPTVALSAAPASKGTFSTTSLTFASGAGETSASFTWTASGSNPSVVVTAAAAGMASATCTLRQS